MKRVVLAGIALVLLAPPWEAQQLSYEGALSGSTGTYIFTERTNSFILSTGLYLKAGRLSFRGTLPVWLQNTTLVTSSGAGPMATGGPYDQAAVRDSGQARQQRKQGGQGDGNGPGGNQGTGGQGPGGQRPGPILPAVAGDPVPVTSESVTGYQFALADPTLNGSFRVIQGRRVWMSLGATVKFPLADTATVGSGEWDVGGNLSVSVLAGRRWTFGLDAAYWHLGDLDSLDLVDPLLGSLTAGALLSDHWAASFALTGSTTAITGFDPPVTVTAALSWLGRGASWGLSVGAGLTESAPDFTVGLIWSVPLYSAGVR